MIAADYPVQFSVDYPNRPLDRLTTAFRIFVAIPILIVLSTVTAGTYQSSNRGQTTVRAVGAGGLLFLGPLLMIVFRQKYPRRSGVEGRVLRLGSALCTHLEDARMARGN